MLLCFGDKAYPAVLRAYSWVYAHSLLLVGHIWCWGLNLGQLQQSKQVPSLLYYFFDPLHSLHHLPYSVTESTPLSFKLQLLPLFSYKFITVLFRGSLLFHLFQVDLNAFTEHFYNAALSHQIILMCHVGASIIFQVK